MTAAQVSRICPHCRQPWTPKDAPATRGALAVWITPPRGLYAGRRFHVTGLEAKVLHHLVRSPTGATSKDLVADAFPTNKSGDKQLQLIVFNLRKRLAEVTGGEAKIWTIHGHGYELEVRP